MSTIPQLQTGSYPFAEIEMRWQVRWEAAGIFHSEPSAHKQNWTVIELPPFANGTLHLGHVRNYTMGDVSARFRRMAGYNVLYTSGFDSFGLPNELAAREERRHPKELAEEVMADMRRQFTRLGLSHDTRRVIGYHEEQYYHWVQWVFLRLFEHGFAYRQKAPVHWCPSCQLTLADSLVVDGQCWRCHSQVDLRSVPQWLIRESDFADELLEGLESLPNWPGKIKQVHADWIGRRVGAEVRFTLLETPGIALSAFVAHPALLPGVAMIAISPEHHTVATLMDAGVLQPEIRERITGLERSVLQGGDPSYSAQRITTSEIVPLGVYAVNPLGGAPIPVFVFTGLDLRSNDGAAIVCPAHQLTDTRLAAVVGLHTDPILLPPTGSGDPFEWDSSWIYASHTGVLAGLTASEGETWILRELQKLNAGGPAVRYRLRDWNIARQRYWGPPVPIIHCLVCGLVPVPDSDLPIRLPMDVDLDVGHPLEHHAGFLHAVCPQCGRTARRDTDTLEAYSSPWWYHWNCKRTTTANPFDKAEASLYMPIDLMIGGEDQTRTCFFHVRMMARALKRAGVVEYAEPIDGLLAIGMVKADGRKMSKSEGNAVEPQGLLARYGADSVRLAMLRAAAPDNDVNWSDVLVRQAHRFLNAVWYFFLRNADQIRFDLLVPEARIDSGYSLSKKLARQVDTAVVKITGAMHQNLFHLAASNLELLFARVEVYEREALKRRKALDTRDRTALSVGSVFLRLLTPLCPHITEVLWSRGGGCGMIALADWPGQLPTEGDNRHR